MSADKSQFLDLKSSTIDVQSLWRRKEAMQQLSFLQSLVKIQSCWKAIQARSDYEALKKSSILFQSVGRMVIQKNEFETEKEICCPTPILI
jgi:myosin heavy subunit